MTKEWRVSFGPSKIQIRPPKVSRPKRPTLPPTFGTLLHIHSLTPHHPSGEIRSCLLPSLSLSSSLRLDFYPSLPHSTDNSSLKARLLSPHLSSSIDFSPSRSTIELSIYLSTIYLSIYLSTFYLSIYLSINLSILISISFTLPREDEERLRIANLSAAERAQKEKELADRLEKERKVGSSPPHTHTRRPLPPL